MAPITHAMSDKNMNLKIVLESISFDFSYVYVWRKLAAKWYHQSLETSLVQMRFTDKIFHELMI